MDKERLWKIIGVISVIAGIIIALTPFNLVHVCAKPAEVKGVMQGAAGGMKTVMGEAPNPMGAMSAPMKCNFMGTSEVYLGLLIAVVGLLIFFAKNGRRSLALMLGVLSIAVMVTPTSLGIGICSKTSMACHRTQDVLTILSVALIAISMTGLLSRKLNFQ